MLQTYKDFVEIASGTPAWPKIYIEFILPQHDCNTVRVYLGKIKGVEIYENKIK